MLHLHVCYVQGTEHQANGHWGTSCQAGSLLAWQAGWCELLGSYGFVFWTGEQHWTTIDNVLTLYNDVHLDSLMLPKLSSLMHHARWPPGVWWIVTKPTAASFAIFVNPCVMWRLCVSTQCMQRGTLYSGEREGGANSHTAGNGISGYWCRWSHCSGASSRAHCRVYELVWLKS